MKMLLYAFLWLLIVLGHPIKVFTQNPPSAVPKDSLYPHQTIGHIFVKFDTWDIKDLYQVNKNVSARSPIWNPKKETKEDLRAKNYVYRIVSAFETGDSAIFIPKPFHRSQIERIFLEDDSARSWYNHRMELEEQFRHAYKKSLSFLNVQINVNAFQTPLEELDFSFGPSIQVQPIGLVAPKLQGILSAGLGIDFPRQSIFDNSIEVDPIYRVYFRIMAPIRAVSLGLQQTSQSISSFEFSDFSNEFFIGFGRDGYGSPFTVKLFYRLPQNDFGQFGQGLSTISNYYLQVGLNIFQIGNGMRNYARDIKIVAKERKASAEKYKKKARRFGL